MIITLKSHQAYLYQAIYRIVSFKDGCIYKTRFLGHAHRSYIWDPDKFVTSSISTKLLEKGQFDLNLITPDDVDN